MIIVNTGLDDGSLPSSNSLVSQIKSTPTLLSWHRPSPGNINVPAVALGAPITDISNLTGKGGTFSNYTTDANRPQFNPGALNGRPGANFDGVNDVLVQNAQQWNLTNPWTMVAVYIADADKNGLQTVLAAYESNVKVTGILQNADALSLRHGTADRSVPLARGQAVCAILSSDTAFIRARVNGVEYPPLSTNNVQPINAPRMGSLDDGVNGNLKGRLIDAMFFTDDLLGHDRRTAALVEQYVTAGRSYRFDFNPLRAR